MKVDKFVAEKHYKIVARWWDKHDHPIIPVEYLSTNGFFVTNNGKPIMCAWLYCTDSLFAYTEHLVTNPLATKRELLEGFKIGFEAIKKKAHSLGRTRLQSRVKSKSLAKIFERNGYKIKNELIEVENG
jgi:hypothetical protein